MTKPALILLACDDPATWSMFERALRATGYEAANADSPAMLDKVLAESSPALVIVNETLRGQSGLSVSAKILERFPTLPVLLLCNQESPQAYLQALEFGLYGCLVPPFTSDTLSKRIQASLSRAQHTGDWLRTEVKRTTSFLEQRVDALETLLNLGRGITSSLELDQVLAQIVANAINLTQADEGSLLLLSSDKQTLQNRAGRIFERIPKPTGQLPIQDSIAGSVVRSGETLVLNKPSLQQANTAFLIQALIYVPLRVRDEIIGVLGVYNHQRHQAFTDQHVRLISILADYAAIAIENARLYNLSESERQKFATILANIESGVIILNEQGKIILTNQIVRQMFNLKEDEVIGRFLLDAIPHSDISAMFETGALTPVRHHEINLDNGHTYNAQFTPISGIGSAITMQEITYLKKLDQLKNEFVHTVSHDLRSPLTAVMGYAELLERVGPMTPQQKEFVQRIQTSVGNITGLINDLLDLGRIESGFDALKEDIQIDAVLKLSIDNLKSIIDIKHTNIQIDIAADLLPIHGNPIRMKQMLDNLVSNAVKYTPENGTVTITLRAEGSQLILQISDTGPGIPPTDQPHIFDKFYRASNVPQNTPGTGLGLAIVKSIVENHLGRIWVDSTIDEGTTFTVVLPASGSND